MGTFRKKNKFQPSFHLPIATVFKDIPKQDFVYGVLFSTVATEQIYYILGTSYDHVADVWNFNASDYPDMVFVGVYDAEVKGHYPEPSTIQEYNECVEALQEWIDQYTKDDLIEDALQCRYAKAHLSNYEE